MKSLDLNCDMGEGFGVYKVGDDEQLLRYVTSANVACGFHAGDPGTMAKTVRLAVAAGVSVGAHPSLADLQGFGRREMAVSPAEVYDAVAYQLGALKAIAKAAGTSVRHVKTHGALYNMAAKNEQLSEAISRAVKDVDRSLLFYAPAGTLSVTVARDVGLRVLCEVFGDRTYQDDGTITPRKLPRAMITSLDESVVQVKNMLQDGFVRSLSGREVPIEADTLCIHGDQPGAVSFARGLRQALTAAGVTLSAPSHNPH